jgi:phospholipid/cholesterol/gamma-HCH transport system ATP-binding protein
MSSMTEPLLDRASTAAALREALQRALRQERALVNRLSYAHTSVCFALPDGDVTLALDQRPPVVDDAADADVYIHLDEAQARQLTIGALSLPIEIAAGRVASDGPVRRYLEVEPILRALLWDGAAGGAMPTSRAPAGAKAHPVVDPDLLALETRGVHKSFGSHDVLAGVDLRIPEGMISVVLGPSGTGKSVLLQHIVGLMRPDAGEVLVRGRSLSGMSRADLLALRRSIGVMFQDGALLSAMDLFDNVAFPLRQHTEIPEDRIRDIVMSHLATVGLANDASKMPNQLSGGMRKRAGLARALALEPGILLCDEPDSGLDPVRTALLGDLLVEQHAQFGGTMVVVTHNVSLATQIADHMSVLWQGRVIEDGLSEEILESDSDFVRQFLHGETRGPLSMDA